ncbi:UvrD-helicase domain-containing protein [Lachnospiraceae bacterium 42-17]
MGLFEWIFKYNKRTDASKTDISKNEVPAEYSAECEQLLNLREFINELLDSGQYTPRSSYKERLYTYDRVIHYFKVLIDSESIDDYCKRNGLETSAVHETIERYGKLDELVEAHNENFIKESLKKDKEYFDCILKSVDPKILLDEEQRRVVLTDEDYCLVIAGAGAGKTTTVAAKVRYLVEKKEVDPKQILVISFTNKAVQELKEKINKDLNIDCPIATFHSTGNAILNKHSPEKLNIVDSSKLYFVLQDYFRTNILKNESLVNNLILFFASYFDAPYKGDDLNQFFNKIAKSDFSTMRSDLNEFQRQVMDTRTKKMVTIQNEILRSYQEVEIANFLYLNGIDYEYEPIYQYHILLSRKPYTPDFVLKQGERTAYLEHFGLTEEGENNRYTSRELSRYKKAVNDKILLHRKHGTHLLYTFSAYNDKRSLTKHLEELLVEHGFVLKPRSNKEILEKLVASEENRYIKRLVNLICRFITNFKTNGYTSEEFNRMYHTTKNERTKLFLNICNDCYLEYERYLKENHAVDFEDMINESAQVLREVEEMKQKLDFKYIIVDEYQDISKQRFDLVKAMREVTDAKIIAVGDDWQSIYAFSGSDITLFTKFAEKMGYAKLLKITKTYRNSQEVIDIAGNFIQKNTAQITKALKSPKNIEDPVIIYTYDSTRKDRNGDNRSGVNYAIAHAIETALGQIVEYNKAKDTEKEDKKEDSSILLLGRFGFDGERLERSGLFEYINRGGKLKSVKYPKLNITFMTAHASKGLGYDNVIVVNGRNETYGFPSKIEDDPVLALVIKGDRSIDYAEERRLFYVAMTRTKNRVYFIAPEQNPSEFLLEIKRDYKNIVLKGNWNEEVQNNNFGKKACPICGYPMQYRYKNAYGLRLYICTNEPEICGFMTNEYGGGKLSITKCEQCRDGYLIVKKGRGGQYFLGCSNYKKDGTGCNNSMSKEKYFEMMKYKEEPEKHNDDFKAGQAVCGVQDTAEKQAEKGDKGIKSISSVDGAQAGDHIAKAALSPVIYRQQDLNDIICTVLNCLSHISEKRYYGVTILMDTLQGVEDNKKITGAGLNHLPEYGKLKNVPKDEIKVIVEWMIENHFILKTKGQYPVLHPTYEGMHYDKIVTGGMLKRLKKYLEMTEGRNDLEWKTAANWALARNQLSMDDKI